MFRGYSKCWEDMWNRGELENCEREKWAKMWKVRELGKNATADFKQISNSTADFNLGNAGSFVPPISKNINSNKDNLSLANWRESQPPISNKFQIQLPISILRTLVLLSNQYLKISTLTKIIYHWQIGERVNRRSQTFFKLNCRFQSWERWFFCPTNI